MGIESEKKEFNYVSVKDFRKELQDNINNKLPLMLVRHSTVVAVILSPEHYNKMVQDLIKYRPAEEKKAE